MCDMTTILQKGGVQKCKAQIICKLSVLKDHIHSPCCIKITLVSYIVRHKYQMNNVYLLKCEDFFWKKMKPAML